MTFKYSIYRSRVHFIIVFPRTRGFGFKTVSINCFHVCVWQGRGCSLLPAIERAINPTLFTQLLLGAPRDFLMCANRSCYLPHSICSFSTLLPHLLSQIWDSKDSDAWGLSVIMFPIAPDLKDEVVFWTPLKWPLISYYRLCCWLPTLPG